MFRLCPMRNSSARRRARHSTGRNVRARAAVRGARVCARTRLWRSDPVQCAMPQISTRKPISRCSQATVRARRCATVRDGATVRARYHTVVLGKQPLSGVGAAEVSRLGAAGPLCRDTANRDGPQPTKSTLMSNPKSTKCENQHQSGVNFETTSKAQHKLKITM